MPHMEAAPAVIRVVLAENTRMANQLLSNAFPRDHRFKLVGQAVTSSELLQAISAGCDVAVVAGDLDREGGGMEVTRTLRDSLPQVKLVLLLDDLRNEPVVAAFRAGARAVFGRNESLHQLWKCLACVHAGQFWAGNRELQFVFDALQHSMPARITDAEGISLLTEQEEKVVFHVCEGITNREIAERMGLSEHTVKNHLFRIYSRLGLSSRVEVMFSVLAQHVIHAPHLTEAPVSDADLFQTYLEQAEHSAEAQFAIGNMCLQGRGTSKDLSAAYMWLFLAEHTVRQLLRSCTSLKDHVGAQITTGDKATAETLAAARMANSGVAHQLPAACKPRHPDQRTRAPQISTRNRRVSSVA